MKKELVFENVNLLSRDGKLVLHDINFSLNANIVGVYGKSGSGKTSLAKLIANQISPTFYSKLINEYKTVYIDQDYAGNLFPNLTVFENIADGLKNSNNFKKQVASEVENASRIVDRYKSLIDKDFGSYYKTWNTAAHFNEFTKTYLEKDSGKVRKSLDQISDYSRLLKKYKTEKAKVASLKRDIKTIEKNKVKSISNIVNNYKLTDQSKDEDLLLCKYQIDLDTKLIALVREYVKAHKIEELDFELILLLDERVNVLNQLIKKLNDGLTKEAAKEFKKIFYKLTKQIEKFTLDYFVINHLVKLQNKLLEQKEELSKVRYTSQSTLLSNTYKGDSREVFNQIEEAFAKKLENQFNIELLTMKDIDKKLAESIEKLTSLKTLASNKVAYIDSQVNQICKDLEIDQTLFNSNVGSLSSGQAQRVLLAKVMIVKPELIIFDEPTSSLDATTTKLFTKQVELLTSKFGISCILISHDNELMKNLAKYIYIMENGYIVEKGNTKDVFSKPTSVYLKQLLGKSKDTLTINKSFFSQIDLKNVSINHQAFFKK